MKRTWKHNMEQIPQLWESDEVFAIDKIIGMKFEFSTFKEKSKEVNLLCVIVKIFINHPKFKGSYIYRSFADISLPTGESFEGQITDEQFWFLSEPMAYSYNMLIQMQKAKLAALGLWETLAAIDQKKIFEIIKSDKYDFGSN